MMKFNSQNSSEISKTPLIWHHAAHLMTRLTCVRPTVDLIWKALSYLVLVHHTLLIHLSTFMGPPSHYCILS